MQVSVEGTEQLESYFGQYVPQLFYALIAPITLFVALAPLSLPAAVALLVCVPFIPASIVAVQKSPAAPCAIIGAVTPIWAVCFSRLFRGLTTLKIYSADAQKHKEMNTKLRKASAKRRCACFQCS